MKYGAVSELSERGLLVRQVPINRALRKKITLNEEPANVVSDLPASLIAYAGKATPIHGGTRS